MNLSKLILLIFTIPICSANMYFGGEYGKSFYNSSTGDKYNLTSTGNGYGFLFGQSLQFLGFEAFYKQHSPVAKIVHNGTEYKLLEKTNSFGAAVRFNTEYTFVKLGYAYHKQAPQILSTSDAPAGTAVMNRIYSAGTDTKTSGFTYGAGVQLRFTKSFRMTLGYDYYNSSVPNEGYHQIMAGFIMKLPELSANFVD